MDRWYEPLSMALAIYICVSTTTYLVWVTQTGSLTWHAAYWIPTLLALIWAQARCLRGPRNGR